MWYTESNYLVILNIENEEKLIDLLNKAKTLNIKSVGFREDDLDGQYTAIALAPCKETKKLCQNLKLALSSLK